MKQTNNAIKFLMAQYRAIFKNANIAMLAAIAASALAAGQAQADVNAWDKLASQTFTSGDKLQVSGSDTVKAPSEAFNITISSGDAHFIKSDANAGTFAEAKDKASSITINGDKAKLTIGATDKSGATVEISNFNVTKGTLAITGSGTTVSTLKAGAIVLGTAPASPDAPAAAANPATAIIELNDKGVVGDATKTTSFDIYSDGELKFTKAGAKAASKNGINLNGGKISVAAAATDAEIKGGLNVLGGSVDIAASGALTVSGAMSITNGTVTAPGGAAAANVGTLTVKGDLSLNGKGAKIDLKEGASGGKLTVSGTTTATAGTLSLGSGSTATFNGDASFASGTLTAVSGAKIDLGTIAKSGSRVLTVNSNDIKELLKVDAAITVSGDAAAGDTFTLAFNDADTSVLDLSDSGLNLVTANTGANTNKVKHEQADLIIKGNSAKFLGAKFSGSTTYDFQNIQVGSGSSVGEETFALEDGANLTVGKSISTKDGAPLKTLTVTKGTLTLAGEQAVEGTVEASTVVLSGSKNTEANLKVTGGQWSVADLTLTKGTAVVSGSKDDGLDVAGTLTLTKDSTLTVNGGYVSTLGTGKVAFKEAADNGVKLTNGTLKFDGDDVLKDSKLADVIKKNAISGDGASVIVIDNASAALTQAQFIKLKEDLGTNFAGSFDMNVTLDKIEGDLNKNNIVTALKTDEYNDRTYNAEATENISGTLSVGNVKKNGTENLKLEAGGNLFLNDASAEKGSGNFVTINSGSGTTTGGVVFADANNTLSLGGSGKIASITAEKTKNGSVNIGVHGKEYNAGHVTVVAGNSIGSSSASIKGLFLGEQSSLVVESGDVYTAEFVAKAGTAVDVKGGITTEKFSFNGASLSANKLTISDAGSAAKNTIAGGANVTLTELSLGKNNALLVGEDGTGIDGDLGSSAKVYTSILKMHESGASIFVDPNYGTGAALFATNQITDAAGAAGNNVKGNVAVGKNAAFGVGFDSMYEFEKTLAPYMVNGGFDGEGAVKNALVLNKQLTIASGNGITIDETLTDANYPSKVSGNALTLGAGAALIVTQDALASDGAVKFANGTGKVEAADDGSSLVIFAADVTKQDSGKKIFGNGTNVDTALKGQAAGGLLDVAFNQDGTITLTSNDKRLGEMRQHISEPTTQLFADYRDGKFAGAVGSLGYKFVYESLTAPGDAYKAVDIAAHAATYAGAQQAAVAAVTTMADAMFGRVGAVGVEAATIAATGSQANGGVWLTPMYKSVDSDGFGAQGGAYGADVDLSGVAFGTDTVNGNMRFGAVFNIGSGDTEGKGLGNGLKDEFDYYGFGIYSAMGFGNFALVGDASMTVISHEVEGLGLKGKADTTAVTMGLTGQYTVATPMVDVTPHLGARFIRLNTDSYDLVSADGVLATTDFDVQNVFSVPLGVTLSKAFVAGGWTLAPSADLTIAFNSGDTEAKSSNQFTGIKAYEYSTEVLDEVQYGLTVGLGAQNGAFGTSFGINYTGSENTDAFGVNAQCRYMF